MKILLPGLDKQLAFLKKNYDEKPNSILVVGSSSELIAIKLAEIFKCNVELIVEEYESLLAAKLLIDDSENIFPKIMNYDSTDYHDNQFDLIFAQASVSSNYRTKIIKELKRILKPSGYLCVGEIVVTSKEVPKFIQDVFNNSSLVPIQKENIISFYQERNFTLIARDDLSYTLREYYIETIREYEKAEVKLSNQEKSYYKKLINKISHESNVYLKLGGKKHFGFEVLLLQKEER